MRGRRQASAECPLFDRRNPRHDPGAQRHDPYRHDQHLRSARVRVRRGIVCNAFDYGPGNSVKGVLRLTPGEEDVAWIEGDGGRHQSVLWPEGFVLELEPTPALLSDSGRLIGHDGDPIRLNNTAPDEAAGTFADPYLAHGRTLFGCYP